MIYTLCQIWLRGTNQGQGDAWGMQHTQNRHAYKVLVRKSEDKRTPLIYESGSSVVKITLAITQKPDALFRDSNITQIVTKVDSKPHIYSCQGLAGCYALSNLLYIVSFKLFQSSQVEHGPLLPLAQQGMVGYTGTHQCTLTHLHLMSGTTVMQCDDQNAKSWV